MSLKAIPKTTRPRMAAPAPSTVARPRTVMQITWSLVAGGAEMYALTIASNLDRQRYRPVMCGIDQGGALELEIANKGLPYIIMTRRWGIDWKLMWRLFRLFREWRVDVIHTHHFNQLFYSIPGAMLCGARIIHTEHSIECYKKRRLRVALRLLSLFCSRVTAIGKDGETVLRQQVGIPTRKLMTIRAGVDLSAFDADRRQARAALKLTNEDRVAVIVARLFPEKNHELLLQAFDRVRRQIPSAKLLIVGDGTERESVSAAVAKHSLRDCVRMLGVRRDIPRILAASDVFVLSSDREGLPIAVLEAMAARLPVVATAVGDLPLVVTDGKTGRLAPRHDAEALAQALIEILSDPERARRMGEAGRELVQAEYGVESMVRRHEALYEAKRI